VNKVQTDWYGCYMLQYLPQGTYDVVFESKGYEKKNMSISIDELGFNEIDAELSVENTGQPQPPSKPEISAPKLAAQGSVIEVELTDGGIAISGKAVSVQTPAGAITAITDSNGKAKVNAAQSGSYVFTYGDVSATVSVPAKTQANTSKPPPITAPVGQLPEEPGVQAAMPAITMIAVVVGAFAILALILFVALLIMRSRGKISHPGGHEHKEPHHHKHAAEHSHKHKHE
jgi:hypothetical protein